MKYDIVKASSIMSGEAVKQVIETVNEKLGKGWKLHGNLIVNYDYHGKEHVHQAIIKE